MADKVMAFAAEKTKEGQKVALITVTETCGSSPSSPGQVMAVLADGSYVGTVGGGQTEHDLILRAGEAIKNGETVFSFSFDHSEHGMTCGGSMSGFGNILGAGTKLIIFGGGHISQSLAKIAVITGFSVTVVDDRKELASSFETSRYITCQPGEYPSGVILNPGDFAVICTRGHERDGEALRYCLKYPLKYLGMIGSRKKVAGIFEGLTRDGFSESDLKRIYTPIGLNIASSSPAEIAVSILAEILLIKNNGTPEHKRG